MNTVKPIKIDANSMDCCSGANHLANEINKELSQYQDSASMILWKYRAESALQKQGYMKYYGYGWIGYYHPIKKCYVQIQNNSDKLLLLMEENPIIF
jgi:hypothetical protein